MGLSSAISGGIVLVVLIYVLLLMPGALDQTSIVQDAANEISDLEKTISETSITLSSLTATQGSSLITFTVNNYGNEKLWQYEKFTVIITYDGVTSDRLSEVLSYSGTCSGDPSSGNWCIDSISSDVSDPGVLNSNESMLIKLRVNENVDTGIVIALISTNNGITSSISGSL